MSRPEKELKGAASFRHNPKRAKIPHNKYGFLALFFCFVVFLRLKFYKFLPFYALFVSSFPHSPYFYTAIARQPTISALNQASPKGTSH